MNLLIVSTNLYIFQEDTHKKTWSIKTKKKQKTKNEIKKHEIKIVFLQSNYEEQIFT